LLAAIRLLASFFSNVTAPTRSSTLSLHDALPISSRRECAHGKGDGRSTRPSPFSDLPSPRAGAREVSAAAVRPGGRCGPGAGRRSEEHTSELQSRFDLVCRLLLDKEKRTISEQPR